MYKMYFIQDFSRGIVQVHLPQFVKILLLKFFVSHKITKFFT